MEFLGEIKENINFSLNNFENNSFNCDIYNLVISFNKAKYELSNNKVHSIYLEIFEDEMQKIYPYKIEEDKNNYLLSFCYTWDYDIFNSCKNLRINDKIEGKIFNEDEIISKNEKIAIFVDNIGISNVLQVIDILDKDNYEFYYLSYNERTYSNPKLLNNILDIDINHILINDFDSLNDLDIECNSILISSCLHFNFILNKKFINKDIINFAINNNNLDELAINKINLSEDIISFYEIDVNKLKNMIYYGQLKNNKICGIGIIADYKGVIFKYGRFFEKKINSSFYRCYISDIPLNISNYKNGKLINKKEKIKSLEISGFYWIDDKNVIEYNFYPNDNLCNRINRKNSSLDFTKTNYIKWANGNNAAIGCFKELPNKCSTLIDRGTLYHTNGNKFYDGSFKKKKNNNDQIPLLDKGIRYYSNGNKKYKGKFKNRTLEGNGIGFWDNGNVFFEGNYKCGKPHGRGIIYNYNGNKLAEGFFEKGYLKGDGKIYFNGILREKGYFENGILKKGTIYGPYGKIAEGEYEEVDDSDNNLNCFYVGNRPNMKKRIENKILKKGKIFIQDDKTNKIKELEKENYKLCDLVPIYLNGEYEKFFIDNYIRMDLVNPAVQIKLLD
jgi:antitoxin component YwqK of YwqJK toxin-antitoxin module